MQAQTISNGDITDFYRIAEILEARFNISFMLKLDNCDDYYWDFQFEGVVLTLHYNTYIGIEIFPKSMGEASHAEEEQAAKIATLVKSYL